MLQIWCWDCSKGYSWFFVSKWCHRSLCARCSHTWILRWQKWSECCVSARSQKLIPSFLIFTLPYFVCHYVFLSFYYFHTIFHIHKWNIWVLSFILIIKFLFIDFFFYWAIIFHWIKSLFPRFCRLFFCTYMRISCQ